MAVKNKGLGRGLDALLDEIEAPEQETHGKIEVNLYDIDTNPNQPRKTFDPEKLAELASSIKRHGVVQPILVKKNGARYMFVSTTGTVISPAAIAQRGRRG